MNNCPKCGNPLQVGTASCPICGTNILESAPAQPAAPKKEDVSVASVGTPNAKPEQAVQKAAPAPTPAPAPAPAPVKTEAPVVAPTPAPVQQPIVEPSVKSTPVIEEKTSQNVVAAQEQPPQVASQEVKVEKTEGVQPTQPAQEIQASTNQSNVQTQNVTPQIQPTVKVEETKTPEKIDVASIAPTVPRIEATTPIPSVPAEHDNANTTLNVEAPKVEEKNVKKPMNKNVLIIGGVLLVVLVAAGIFMITNNNSNLNNQPQNPNNSLAATSISSNGYKFNLLDGWLINEDNTNVIVTNSNETVVIKLEHLDSGINKINKEIIEGYFKTRTEFTSTEVKETKVNSKDAYFVNTSINQAPVQVYFISGNTELTLGATIVYQSAESKTKYEAEVVELIETLSYSDDSIKAISSMQMYSNIFNVYGGVANYDPSAHVVEQTPQENTTPNVDNGTTTEPVTDITTENNTEITN